MNFNKSQKPQRDLPMKVRHVYRVRTGRIVEVVYHHVSIKRFADIF